MLTSNQSEDVFNASQTRKKNMFALLKHDFLDVRISCVIETMIAHLYLSHYFMERFVKECVLQLFGIYYESPTWFTLYYNTVWSI